MPEEAASAYEELLSESPTHLEASLRLGHLYTQLGEPYKALRVFQRAQEMEPENPDVHLQLAEVYQGLGRIEEATRAYQEVLRLDPSNEWAQTRLRLFSHPIGEEIPHPLLRSAGQQLALLGYDIRPAAVEVGGSLLVTLWWQAVSTMDQDYTVFIHLTDSQGRLWAQYDGLLTHGDRPTSAWRLGLIVKGDYELELPLGAPPGDYQLMTGVYDWQTGERLPVWDHNGERTPHDTATFGSITLLGADDTLKDEPPGVPEAASDSHESSLPALRAHFGRRNYPKGVLIS
jgi:tetratricopeptide (TPR) repeat protein